MTPVESLWVYLAEKPLLWLTVTLVAYLVADRIAARFGYAPLANPVVMATALVVICLRLSGTAYPVYFEGAQFVHFLLGPATVALAIPFVENIRHVRRALLPLLLALAAGSVTAVGSALALGYAFGLPHDVLVSLAPKSVTTPIAMGIAERLGAHAAQATGSATRVMRALLMTEEPSLDRGEITDKGSINQRAVLRHRGDLVAALYSDSDPRVIRAQKKEPTA